MRVYVFSYCYGHALCCAATGFKGRLVVKQFVFLVFSVLLALLGGPSFETLIRCYLTRLLVTHNFCRLRLRTSQRRVWLLHRPSRSTQTGT